MKRIPFYFSAVVRTQSQPWNKCSVLLQRAVEAAELGHGIHSGGGDCGEVAFQLACIREVGIIIKNP